MSFDAHNMHDDQNQPQHVMNESHGELTPEFPVDAMASEPSRAPWQSKNVIIPALLIVILAVGAYFRFVGENWDDYTHLHPDERFLTGVANSLGNSLQPSGDSAIAAQQTAICQARYPQTGGAATSIFDSLCSTWYPKNANNGTGLYVYGELPMYIVKVAALTLNDLENRSPAIARLLDGEYVDVRGVPRNWDDYNGIHLVGRFISASAELLSLVFLFLIGRRLYNEWVGLLAAALGAAAVFPIQLSHFFTMDAFTNLPLLIAFWFATRALDRGRLRDFVGFGVMLGAAIASRINVLPLFGVIGLAAIVYALPAFDMSLLQRERSRLIWRAIAGVLLAFLFTVITFRVTMPHAFQGGPGILGFFDIGPADQSVLCPTVNIGGISFKTGGTPFFYCPWVADLAQVQSLTSGAVDFPPDHQWANRKPYLFPFVNIVLWGMGLPLGLMAWLGWTWAGLQVIRARRQWTRHILPVVWILVYFGYMGRQWVMTMRYFMPIYPFLILMASWALYEIVTRAYRWLNAHPTVTRRIVAVGAAALLVVVVGATFLYAEMFTSIYRRQLTRVEASRWVLANLPSAISANFTLPDGSTRLINFGVQGMPGVNVTRYETPEPKVISFVASARNQIDRVIVSHLTAAEQTGGPRTFNVAIAQNQDGSQIITHGQVTGNFDTSDGPYGKSYTIMLDQPLTLDPTQSYFLVTWTDTRLIVSRKPASDKAEFIFSDADGNDLGEARLPDNPNFSGDGASATSGDQPITAQFTTSTNGTIDHLTVPHLLNPLGTGTSTDFVVTLRDGNSHSVLAQGKINGDFGSTKTSMFGEPVTIKLDKPLTVGANQQISVEASSPQGVPLQVTGTVIANEGPWDDPIPWKVCPLPLQIDLTHDTPSGLLPVTCDGVDGFSWYKGPELQMAAEDDNTKRQAIETGLAEADYYTISSNRFYDTVTRIPMRYPMSIAFYKALFSEQLGFDLLKTITSYPSIGNFEIADQYLPTYKAPAWLNEWRSEEAFSVYDHPTVFIFKKDSTFSAAALDSLLNKVPTADAKTMDVGKEQDETLINRITWSASEASHAPTAYMLTPEQQAIQAQGGTWQDLFDRVRAVNNNQIVAVIVWWVAILIFGFAAWPILFSILPGLPDRGYPFAKLAGLLIVSWIVWVGGTLHLLTWSPPGIAITLLGPIAVSAVIVVRNREALFGYMRLNWRHMIIVELIMLVMFLAFVLVRLGNPDLWAQTLGGEKPMDFAYFNAVLKSTIFPPYDPWYSGGYLNYYYFGFVLVGTPVKLLGMMPSIAYNLIVPTLFSLTGIGAFSVAFNIVASRWFFPRDEGSENGPELAQRRRFALRTPQGSPYIAGVMALLLCVVLGNLDTPRQFFIGLARAGGYTQDETALYNWEVAQFVRANNRQPTPDESQQLMQAALHPSFNDQIAFGLQDSAKLVNSLGRGISDVLGGGLIPMSPDRWFWGPTRIVAELPNASNEINEMPYFTFVFADLHAHMIAFPLTLLALAWILSEVLAAGHIMRGTTVAIAATVFGGLVIGALQATNTWDWITYLLLGVLGLIFAMILRRQRLTRRVASAYVGQLVGFGVAQWAFALPFTLFWSTSYLGASALQSFTGNKTPIWAYMDINGLFIFIILTLLIWQTVRLLRHVYVRDLVRRVHWVILVVAVFAVVIAISLFMTSITAKISLFSLPIPLAVLLLPMLVWCVLLFFSPDQPREWQIIYALIGLGLAISFGVEVIVLGADIGRQNTFFKFYLQVWILFSVACGVALAWLFNAAMQWRGGLRTSWLTATAVLLSVAGLFPIMSTQGKIAMRMAPEAPHVLDGDAYMQNAVYVEGSYPIPLKDDLAIIRWFQDNVKGSPVILEGYMTEYKLGARISINTGLPTVQGWNFHQRQQRTIDPLPNLVTQRDANIAAMYNTTDIDTAWQMLKFFNVQYIVSAKLEKVVYTPEGLAKFDTMVDRKLLEVVYSANGDKVYHVIPGAILPDIVAGG